MQFRATTARDFLASMRAAARKLRPEALITCNNSLNAPEQFFAQSRSLAYNIHELSKVEDFVLVEDMATQPRTEAAGATVEYGPLYELLHAISHGKPVVACTLAGGDYHTPPRLVRLAMAEAAAHGASYLCWPTWPEDRRTAMAAAVWQQSQLLAAHEDLLNEAPVRDEATLFLPFRQWLDSEACAAAPIAAALTRANVQYRVISEDDFSLASADGRPSVLVVESRSALNAAEARAVEQFERGGGRIVAADGAEWLEQLRQAIGRPAIVVGGPPTLRAVVRDQAGVGNQPGRTIVHLYNLNIERLSSFDDRVTPAERVVVGVRVPYAAVQEVDLRTADEGVAAGPLPFTVEDADGSAVVRFTVPRIDVSAIVVITP